MKEVYEAPEAEVVNFAAMESIALIDQVNPAADGPVTDGNQSIFDW